MKPFPKIWSAVILSIILLMGLLLRIYNLSFPSIGYHNMQENEYMGIAREMERTHDYASKKVYFAGIPEYDPSATAGSRLPLISYQALISWKIFGENLWGPRFINVIFGILSILILYFISNQLFRNRLLSLFASLLLAVMPLAVFFSRNLQPESPALFFMLLGNFFYLKFVSARRRRDLLLGGLAFSAAWFYKSAFLIGALPFISYLPIGAKGKKKRPFRYYALSLILPYLLIVPWLSYINGFNVQRFLEIFSYSYWKDYGMSILLYMIFENFNPIFMVTSLIGMGAALLKRDGHAERYIIGWTAVIIPYCILFSGPLSQNNYSQMPFLALVCVSSTYAAYFVSEFIKKFIKKEVLVIVLAVIILSSAPFVFRSIIRMHSKVFIGADVAGESLRGFTKPDEHIFLFTHSQGFGIARYAGRYAEWTYNAEDFKKKEKLYNIRYICIYPAEFILSLKMNTPKLFEYIVENYHVKEAGMTEEPKKLFYLIMEKGKGCGSDDPFKTISGETQLKTIYRIIDNYVFFYALRPQQDAGK